jgi:hypothetical protein
MYNVGHAKYMYSTVSNVSVFTSFRMHAVRTLACAHLSFLRSRVCLIGRRDRTALIDRSQCRVGEKSFLEPVGHGEAQLPLIPAR